MDWKIYLSGEIHSNWREEIILSTEKENLPIKFFGPVTDHASSDDCGVKILGHEENKSVDYPDFAKKLSRKVSSTKGSLGILLCG